MFIVLGGTGHVGSAVASTLLDAGESVTIVTRDAGKAEGWKRRGATVAEADVTDTDRLREVLRTGRRAFLLNPPAPPSTDTDVEERRTIAAILEAVEGSGLERVVAESTYGAQPGERCGDLNTLYELEEGLRALDIPTAIVRAAYYFSNFDMYLESAAKEGVLPTMIPADLVMPMVAPADLGRVGARLLAAAEADTGIHYVEGPERYSADDVAAAFSDALGKKVKTAEVPREKWVETFKENGFSDPAAESYAKMTAVSVDGGFAAPEDAIKGNVTLEDYVADLVAKAKADAE